MSLSQADKQVLQHFFGEEVIDKLSGAITSETEVSLGLSTNGKKLMSQEEIDNATKANQDAYIEIGYKKVAKEAGIELDSGEKDPKIIADKLKAGITSSLEEKYKNMTPTEELLAASEKAKEWENKYNKLNETYEGTVSKVGEWEQKYTGLEKEIKTKDINNRIRKSFPDKMKMDIDDALLIVRNNFEFEDGDNGMVIKRNGETITDPVGNPDKMENVIKSFVEEKKWIKSSGMGGGDRSGGGSGLPKGMNDDDAIKYIVESGNDPMSPEGSKMLMELTAKE